MLCNFESSNESSIERTYAGHCHAKQVNPLRPLFSKQHTAGGFMGRSGSGFTATESRTRQTDVGHAPY